jgi:hypothetical protein
MPVTVTGIVGVEAVITSGRIHVSDGLYFSVLPFYYEIDGKRQLFTGALNELATDDAVNYVYLDFDGSLNVNTTGYPSTTHIRLGRVVAADGVITSLLDDRVLLSAGIDREIRQNKDEGQSSTTSTSYEQKVRLELDGIPDGAYIVQWYVELRHSNNTPGEIVEMRVEVNDTNEIGFSTWMYNVWEDAAGFTIQDVSAGDHFIDLDFRVQGGGTAYCRRARLLFWRIA